MVAIQFIAAYAGITWARGLFGFKNGFSGSFYQLADQLAKALQTAKRLADGQKCGAGCVEHGVVGAIARAVHVACVEIELQSA